MREMHYLYCLNNISGNDGFSYKNNIPDDKSAEKYINQYNLLQNIAKELKGHRGMNFKSLEDFMKKLLNRISMELQGKHIYDSLMKELFLDVINFLEQYEFNEAITIETHYCRASFKGAVHDDPTILDNSLKHVLSRYITILENTYTQMTPCEKVFIKKYYYIKCNIIDTFNWLTDIS